MWCTDLNETLRKNDICQCVEWAFAILLSTERRQNIGFSIGIHCKIAFFQYICNTSRSIDVKNVIECFIICPVYSSVCIIGIIFYCQ